MSASNDIIKKYFSSWSSHDVDALDSLFHRDAVYSIQGKRDLHGLMEIKSYWRRNRERQKNIIVHPFILEMNKSKGYKGIFGPSRAVNFSVTFCSEFYDCEEREYQVVYGCILFELDGEKIASVSESYRLVRKKNLFDHRGLLKAWGRIYYNICLNLEKYVSYIWYMSVTKIATAISFLMAILLGFSATKINAMPDYLLCFLSSKAVCLPGDASIRAEILDEVFHRLSSLTAMLLVFMPFLYYFKYKIEKPVKTDVLVRRDQDLIIMKNHFNKANDVTIFSGDFSFIGNDPEMMAILASLDGKDGLRLISSKAEAEVRRGFGDNVMAATLFTSLKSKRKIKFESDVPIKCSIVRNWDYEKVLYRFEHGGAEGETHRLRLCVLEGRGEIAPLVGLVKQLCQSRAY